RMKPQHRNAEFINDLRIDLAITIFPGDSFTSARHAYMGTIKISVILFQRRAIAARLFLFSFDGVSAIQIFNAPLKSVQRHSKPSSIFNMIASWEIKF